MTDHEGNRKIHLTLGIQSGLKAVDYYPRLRPRAIVNCFQALLNPLSKIDFPVALMISHYLYNILYRYKIYMSRLSRNGSLAYI